MIPVFSRGPPHGEQALKEYFNIQRTIMMMRPRRHQLPRLLEHHRLRSLPRPRRPRSSILYARRRRPLAQGRRLTGEAAAKAVPYSSRQMKARPPAVVIIMSLPARVQNCMQQRKQVSKMGYREPPEVAED
ncbi:unnamed protein product [Amoebophrya sp. A25]|nr:unnamed protein product [Amoebophrya sp. A25]|eukprot:GSA25T00020180001.1